MRRQRIEHRATTTADPATVYALLRDGAGWPSWSPLDSFELERMGDSEPEGVGAVRKLRKGRVTGRDTIVELVRDSRFSYTNESSLPVRNYRGDVDLEAVAGGTEIRWVAAFDPRFPGTGGLVRRGLEGFIAEMAESLAARATATAGERRRAA